MGSMNQEPQYVTGYRSGLRWDWWQQSFCVEVDWHDHRLPYSRLATVMWEPFTPASFHRAVFSIMTGLVFIGTMIDFLDLVKVSGYLRVRAGGIWCQSGYRGDFFDIPNILEPFNRYPWAP